MCFSQLKKLREFPDGFLDIFPENAKSDSIYSTAFFFLTQKVALISNHSVYVFSIEVQKKRILKGFARNVRIAVQKNCGT